MHFSAWLTLTGSGRTLLLIMQARASLKEQVGSTCKVLPTDQSILFRLEPNSLAIITTAWGLFFTRMPLAQLYRAEFESLPPCRLAGHQLSTCHTPNSAWSLISHLLRPDSDGTIWLSGCYYSSSSFICQGLWGLFVNLHACLRAIHIYRKSIGKAQRTVSGLDIMLGL